MNKEWQAKLTDFGAIVDSDGQIRFADEPGASGIGISAQQTNNSPELVDLSHLAVIDITGSDAKTFLQDQVCNDLTALLENDIQINGYCSPKGRLLAVFTVFSHEDGYRLVLSDDVVEGFTKRLQMFVMRAQVSIISRTDLVCSGLVLEDTVAADMMNGTLQLPSAVMQVSTNQQLQILRWHDAPAVEQPTPVSQNLRQRYLCIADVEGMTAFWQSDSFQHRSSSYWRWADINAGIPSIYASSTDQFIPQMLNMQFIDALSFKKGCYPGQEIVARMQYLGKLKKNMKHLRVPGVSDAPAPGDVLTTESNSKAGQIVDAIIDDAGLNLLAVVNIDTDVSELKVGAVSLVEAPLPYEVVVHDDDQAS